MRFFKIKNLLNDIWEFIYKYFADFILVSVLVVLLIFTFTGTRPLYIMSNSMYPIMKKSTVVIGKEVEIDDEINIGDICTYKDPNKNYTITHRIIDIDKEGKFIFMGDNNSVADPISVDRDWIKYKIIWYPL